MKEGIVTAYAIYLRKSRVDLEAEAAGSGDTLARHRNTLLELAAARQLSVSKIYEEVVSGDTIAAPASNAAVVVRCGSRTVGGSPGYGSGAPGPRRYH